MPTIGIEGPVFAGKTTLIRRLEADFNFGVVEEYGHYTSGSKNFPTFPPKTTTDILVAAKFFANIEEVRYLDCEGLKAHHKNIVIDRTFLTCIAFDYAVSGLTGIDATKETEMFWMERQRITPDITIYLDVSREEQLRRSSGRKPIPEHFLGELFNGRFRSFFIERASTSLVVLDGNRPTEVVLNELISKIDWRV